MVKKQDGNILLFCHLTILLFAFVVPPGFEPGPREPKSLVLPLHHGTKLANELMS
jgi:hypothetical protein